MQDSGTGCSSVGNTQVILLFFAHHLAVTKLAAETQTGSEPQRCCNAPILITVAQLTSRQVPIYLFTMHSVLVASGWPLLLLLHPCLLAHSVKRREQSQRFQGCSGSCY